MTNDNKKLLTGIIVTAAIFLVIIGIVLVGFGITGRGKSANSSSYIGEEKAKSIAFSDAEIVETDATGVTCYLESEDGRMVYDIDFYANDSEYDYEIDAKNGSIVKKEKDTKNVTHGSSSTSGGTLAGENASATNIGNTSGNSSTTAVENITETEAKNIAFKDAGVNESDATNVTSHKETNNGVVVYDISFKHGGYEYDYEINATNGKIIEKDKEKDNL